MNDINEPNKTPKKSLRLRVVLIIAIAALAGVVLIKVLTPKIQTFYAYRLLSRADNWPITFNAVFDEETHSDWKPTDGVINEGILEMKTSDGGLEIVFAPTGETTVRDAFFNVQASAPEDFLLTMKIDPPGSCHAGPVFRGNDRGEYYLFLVADHAYTVEILRRNAEGDLPREALIPNEALPEEVGQPYALTVLAHNSSYYFFINDVFIGAIRDRRLIGSQTGIELFVCQGVTSESVFQVDGFALSAPDDVGAR